MRFRGENPVYKMGIERAYDDTNVATYGGVVRKTAFLLGIIAIVALYFASTLNFNTMELPSNTFAILIGAPIIAIIAVIVTHRAPSIAPISTTIYAIAEGTFLGFISAVYSWYFGDEIVQMALIATFGVLAGMLFLYSTGVIRVGAFFRRLMFSMLIGIILTSVIMLIMAIAGVGVEVFYGLYVAVVVISVIIASLYLLIDFDNITRYVQAGADKRYEWSLSLGLVVTIVWLYIELLRLLAIIANRSR